jgi:hypothetical protein
MGRWTTLPHEGLFETDEAIADGNLIAVNSTMNGRHVGSWAVYSRQRHD